MIELIVALIVTPLGIGCVFAIVIVISGAMMARGGRPNGR